MTRSDTLRRNLDHLTSTGLAMRDQAQRAGRHDLAGQVAELADLGAVTLLRLARVADQLDAATMPVTATARL